MNLFSCLRPVIAALRTLGPYALLELLVPGGTLLAILLYLYRRRMQVQAAANGNAGERA